ncbi:unnamed protein product [Didymodactylos carnosus]|uniref:Uncharacterized protein n=1 Tax=Didymodactylos carnosus TaxID=1234261 RepID=A0A815S1F0_9BILA|nr:unnamed protein product [Didymodactylos carnosus]CAF1485602.1 unnamed protein product [Didymodactylos carnosus]CAF3501825.1 unnamed protein product [Didymodactylos carnosus]CAF4349765.1 unnamed protein product [Didymodactylos carnosus]
MKRENFCKMWDISDGFAPKSREDSNEKSSDEDNDTPKIFISAPDVGRTRWSMYGMNCRRISLDGGING